MLIHLKSLSPVLATISSMSVPICNRFHSKWANNGKVTFLGGTSFWCLYSRGNPAPRGTKFCPEKLESLGQPIQWRFHDFSLHRFDTDHECVRQTDRHPGLGQDTQSILLSRVKMTDILSALCKQSFRRKSGKWIDYLCELLCFLDLGGLFYVPNVLLCCSRGRPSWLQCLSSFLVSSIWSQWRNEQRYQPSADMICGRPTSYDYLPTTLLQP